MSVAPDYRRATGLGEPLLSVRVGAAELTPHRTEPGPAAASKAEVRRG